MKNKLIIPIIALAILTPFSKTAFAYSKDISINESQIKLSTSTFLEGKIIRIYASASSNSESDLLGIVKFFDNNKQISGDQPVSIFANKNDDVFVDWTPTYGQHEIKVILYPWDKEEDNPTNNVVTKAVYVNQDTDRDGITNSKDPDDDNDGAPDSQDLFPLNRNESKDTDGDGIGDNADPDDDNDGVPDIHDDLPLDPNETTDTDKDGIGDIADPDDDNDGLLDTEEAKIGTNPLKADTDNDGINDKDDPFPLDPNEKVDTDKDKIGDNTDTDDDNDGIPDTEDKFPQNKPPEIRLDNENSTVPPNQEISFDASVSKDPDGSIVSYTWKIDGKIQKEGTAISLAFASLGEHNVELTIKDNAGESVTKNFQVNVMNTRLYTQIAVVFITLLLGLLIAQKYLVPKKKK